MGRQSGRSRWHCVTQPFADLGADCAAMDAIDLNAMWLLVGHEGCRLQLYLPNQLPERALVHYEYREPQMYVPAGLENGRLRCTIAISPRREDARSQALGRAA